MVLFKLHLLNYAAYFLLVTVFVAILTLGSKMILITNLWSKKISVEEVEKQAFVVLNPHYLSIQ